MSFDKTKSMRNAERFLSQGKIRAAIGEYQRVVECDPKDYSTLNILGDLYAKGNETDEAVSCFRQVADHYSKQGFAQKAIAVYNKISRLDPNSIEVSEKLAQLYQSRGSFTEARNHYSALAEQYQKKGKKAEALEIWKQIAKLDPNNTDVYLKVAEFCVQNGQKEEATKAYTEAGMRFAAAEQFESALTAFSRALEIRQYDLPALNGYVKAQIKLGYAEDAVSRLEKILEQSPYNREILYLLVDCHLESENLALAEQSIVRLVEQEPANYPKFIELVELYINSGDLESAARILSMSSEHMLVGGKHDEFLHWANEIVARDPEQLDALRLLVRYYGWQRDAQELRNALERLAEIARLHDSIDDEKYALTQLILIVPHEIGYAKRLQEIQIEQGHFAPADIVPILTPAREPAPQFSNFESDDEFEPIANQVPLDQYATFADDMQFAGEPALIAATNGFSGENGASQNHSGDAEIDPGSDSEEEHSATPIVFDDADASMVSGGDEVAVRELDASDELRLSQEIESIEFYLGQGYKELADRSISALEGEFGNRPEFDALRASIDEPEAEPNDEEASVPTIEEFAQSLIDSAPPAPEPQTATITTEPLTPDASAVPDPAEPIVAENAPPIFASGQTGDFLDEFRTELGLEDSKPVADDDFETVFQTSIAYKEMGLLEDAIRGFQEAVNRTKPEEPSRRFFSCCNLLGLCFMEKGMPNLAIMWYRRALESFDLTDEERYAMIYELGNGYQLAGDPFKATECFEEIYAVDVDYRDVSKRLESLQVPSHS